MHHNSKLNITRFKTESKMPAFICMIKINIDLCVTYNIIFSPPFPQNCHTFLDLLPPTWSTTCFMDYQRQYLFPNLGVFLPVYRAYVILQWVLLVHRVFKSKAKTIRNVGEKYRNFENDPTARHLHLTYSILAQWLPTVYIGPYLYNVHCFVCLLSLSRVGTREVVDNIFCVVLYTP